VATAASCVCQAHLHGGGALTEAALEEVLDNLGKALRGCGGKKALLASATLQAKQARRWLAAMGRKGGAAAAPYWE
jgi:hypothetical protein